MPGTLFGTVFLEAFAALGCMGLTLALATGLAAWAAVRAGHAPRLAVLIDALVNGPKGGGK